MGLTIKQILNTHIKEYDEWLSEWFSKDDRHNLFYNTVLSASPLRQLITLLRFIDNCESPHIIITKPTSPIINYNDEFYSYINYLGMSGIDLKISVYSTIYDDKLKEKFLKTDYNNIWFTIFYDFHILNNYFGNKIGLVDIDLTNLIIAYDNKNTNKQLILSTNVIILDDQKPLIKNIDMIKIL